MPSFMTDAWFDAVATAQNGIDLPAGAPPKINLTVQGIDGADVQANIDTSAGFALNKGHLDDADVTLTIPAAVARRMFVDGDQAAGMQAYMAGQLKVEGDITKVMALQGEMARPEAVALRERVAEITE